MSSHLYKALMLISYVNYGISVPPEFCLHPINKHDCHVPRRPVFSYYHPGSRCEIEFWRGCPTRNIFYDEVSCSSTCLYQMYRTLDGMNGFDDLTGEADSNDGKDSHKGTDPCTEHFYDDDCGEPKQTKYYFAGGTCVRTDWTGCKSLNLFDDLPACIRACNPIIYFEPEKTKNIEELTKSEIIDMNKLIDNAISEESKATELPKVPMGLTHNETNHMLLDLYNISSYEMDNTNYAGDLDDYGDYVEAISSENANEADKLAAPDDSVEGSLEEVFTLS